MTFFHCFLYTFRFSRVNHIFTCFVSDNHRLALDNCLNVVWTQVLKDLLDILTQPLKTEAAKYHLADFPAKGVPPPPTPLTENHFARGERE